VPLDPDALVALSDLAAPGGRRSGSPGGPPRRPTRPSGDRHREPEPGAPTATALFRRRLAMLAAGSAIAGLVLGVVLPGPAPAPIVPMAAAPHRVVAAEPAMFLAASASPFAPAPVRAATLVAPAGTSTRKATSTTRAASTSAGAKLATASASATPSSPARVVAAAVDPAQSSTGSTGATGATGSAGPTGVAGPGGAAVAPVAALAPSYRPTRPLPARSGTGRRIVYAETAAHLWVVGDDGAVIRDYAVTGRVGRPKPAVYHVYSKSTVATNPGEKLRFEYMVRFAVGLTGARIGFHTIPRYLDGVPIQSENQLGRAIGSGGCVRQTRADARWLYGWSRVGDAVVVLR